MRVSYAFLANRVSWDAEGLFTLRPACELELTAEPSPRAPYRPVPCRFSMEFTQVPLQEAGPHTRQILIDNLVFGEVPCGRSAMWNAAM